MTASVGRKRGRRAITCWIAAAVALLTILGSSNSVRATEVEINNSNGNGSDVEMTTQAIRQLRKADGTREPRGRGNDDAPKDMNSRIIGGPSQGIGTSSTNPRIIGGQAVDPVGRYPYMVELMDEFGTDISGATLIAPDIVLTAAHSTVINIASVAIGRHDLTDSSEDYDEIQVEDVILNPNFRQRIFNHDAAILKLARSTTRYEPVTLNGDASKPPDDTTLTVMGWGVDESDRQSDILKETTVTSMTNAECEATSYDDDEITDAMLCATGNGVTDACDGDSGGPLITRGDNVTGSADVQVGIVSFGRGCANIDFPGVYTRVSYILPWIQSEVCRLSPQYCASVVPQCVDVAFTTNGGASQTCDWVERRSMTRCPMYGTEHCPVTCGECAQKIDFPTEGQVEQLKLLLYRDGFP